MNMKDMIQRMTDLEEQKKNQLNESETLEECPPMEGSSMDQGTPVNINVSMSATGKEHVEDLLDMMKQAGLNGAKQVEPDMMPMRTDIERLRGIVDKTDMEEEPVEEGDAKEIMHRKAEREDREDFVADAGEMGMTAEEAGEFWDTTNGETESYDNEPDEKYDDHETMIHDLSGGINKKKNSYAAAEPGDNAMAIEDIKSALADALSEKKSKPDFLDLDDDGNKEEPMKKAAADKKAKKKISKKKSEVDENTDVDSVIDNIETNLKLGMSELEKDLSPQAREKIQSAQDEYVNALKDLEDFVKNNQEKSDSNEMSEDSISVEQEVAKAIHDIEQGLGEIDVDIDPSKFEMLMQAAKKGNFNQVAEYIADFLNVEDGAERDAEERSLEAVKEIQAIIQQSQSTVESAPKNNPVAKNAGKFNKAQVQTDKKKQMKKGKDVKHKGKDMTMETPVFDRYVKPFLDKTPKEIVEFYDREALNIIDRLSQERRTLAKAGTETELHESIIGKLREGLSALSEKTLNEARGRRYGGGYRGGYSAFPRRRSSFDIGRTGYGPGDDLGAADKRDFKRRELEIELGDEEPNNYAVYISGKPWKVFRSERSAQKAAATIKSKYGKDAKVYQTAAPASS